MVIENIPNLKKKYITGKIVFKNLKIYKFMNILV